MTQYGPYTLVRQIAVGGMAEIYLARHHAMEGLERTVVLKKILPKFSQDEEFVTMFLDEVRLMAALSHPNIAQVFDLGIENGSHYLTMEYVRGPTLGTVLLGGDDAAQPQRLPEKEALGIALGVAEALSYVHGRKDESGRPLNIVHRDLNPANVLLSYDGAVKLIDFGIAKAATKVYETRTGVIKGTYGYIAPEQFTGADIVDHRADVFALGLLMYEMCVGQHPFDFEEREARLIERIFTADYKRPRQVLPHFPKSLDRLIAECLAPHPEGRPENMRVVIHRITEYLLANQLYPTMGDVAALVQSRVPDREGPAPLKTLRSMSTTHPRATPFSGMLSSIPSPGVPNAAGPNPTVRLSSDAAMQDATFDSDIPTAYGHGVQTGPRDRRSGPRSNPRGAGPSQSLSHADRHAPGYHTSGGRTRRVVWVSLAVLGFVAASYVVNALGPSLWRQWFGPRDTTSSATEGGQNVATRTTASETKNATGSQSDAPRVLRVVSEPSGADIFINNEKSGFSTPADIAVQGKSSRLWIRVALRGYQDAEREVVATAGEARFVLMPLPVSPDPAPR